MRPDPAIAAALDIGSAFDAADLLVYPVYQDLRVEYWTQRQTTGWVPLRIYARPGEATLAHLARRVAVQQTSNGRVWLVVGADGSPVLEPFLYERVGLDVKREDLARIEWGARREAGGRVFREVRAVAP
jgi:hypothetical protein